MREIKFRFWDKVNESLSESQELCDLKYNQLLTPECNPEETVEVMRFTGVNDGIGNEIYSGYIIKDNVGRIWVVDYRDDLGSFILKWKNNQDSWQFFHQFNKPQKPLLIIGNIYETPDLITTM